MFCYRLIGSYRTYGNISSSRDRPRRSHDDTVPLRNHWRNIIKTVRAHLSRERIIDAAYHAWGRHHFVQTSLNLVAQELGVTKPAIYRYFRSKDELLYAMEADYARRLVDFVVTPMTRLRSSKTLPTERPERLTEVVRGYVESVFTMFDEHPFHYLFFVRDLMGRATKNGGPVHAALRSHDAALLALIEDAVPDVKRDLAVFVTRYISTAAAFWTTEHYRTVIARRAATTVEFAPDDLQLSRAKQRRIVENGTQRVLFGFVAHDGAIDLEHVERIAWIRSEEVPERHHVLTAITETVLSVGYNAATVERIANHAGLSKSGLYHYFSNKDAMLSRTVIDGQANFAAVAKNRLLQLANHHERLYALFVMIGSYAQQDPSSIVVENWLRESNIEVQIPLDHIVEIQRIYTFVSEMLVEGQLAGDPEDGFGVLTFINFLVLQELSGMNVATLNTDRLVARVRALFRLFADGTITTLTTNGDYS